MDLSLSEHSVPCIDLIGQTYVAQGRQSVQSLSSDVSSLLEKKKLPAKPIEDRFLELIIQQLSLMDSNNLYGNFGVGEREGRCYSSIVSKRNFHLTHGIGRSGDISEVQPKAAGSSLILKLTTDLAIDAVRLMGVKKTKDCVLLPVATGMALSLCLMALRAERPEATTVVFSRIDQKSCFKSIFTAGYKAIVVEGKAIGDEIHTNVEQISDECERVTSEKVLCVMTTTSCFAPRVPDDLVAVGRICREKNIPHIVNNAYGLQSSKCCHLLSETHRTNGRIDAFVQSMDKNFMVPVGGSIVASFGSGLCQKISKLYPGRASSAPIVDLFITLLSMGSENVLRLLNERREILKMLQSELPTLLAKYKLSMLKTPKNDISMAISLPNAECSRVTHIGSMLFTRFISGARVVPVKNSKTINGHNFLGYGSHISNYPCNYITVAAAIGMRNEDVRTFIKRFDKVLSKWFADNPPENGDELSVAIAELKLDPRKSDTVSSEEDE